MIRSLFLQGGNMHLSKHLRVLLLLWQHGILSEILLGGTNYCTVFRRSIRIPERFVSVSLITLDLLFELLSYLRISLLSQHLPQRVYVLLCLMCSRHSFVRCSHVFCIQQPRILCDFLLRVFSLELWIKERSSDAQSGKSR